MEANNAEVIIYRSPDGKVKVDAHMQGETVWLAQLQMAELFGRDKSVVNRHINNILKEGELDEKVVIANFAITTQHGAFAYGGMPAIMSKGTHEEKGKYLKDLFEKTYIADIVERHRMLNDKAVLEVLLDFISAAVGSLTNAAKLSKTFDGVKHVKIAPQTVSAYLDYFVDAFLVSKSYRYDIKGKRRMGSPWKCYFADVGLRNARLNFRRQEENRVMENIMYNELAAREYDIDVGSVEYNFKRAGKSQRAQLEVDFVANKGSKRYYIQSAPTVAEEEKRMRETNPLNRISDSFKKIVVVKDDMIPWHDENGVLYVAVTQFLLDEEAMDI